MQFEMHSLLGSALKMHLSGADTHNIILLILHSSYPSFSFHALLAASFLLDMCVFVTACFAQCSEKPSWRCASHWKSWVSDGSDAVVALCLKRPKEGFCQNNFCVARLQSDPPVPPQTFWKRAAEHEDQNPFINNLLTFTTADYSSGRTLY